MGGRLRLLVLIALAGCVGMFLLLRWVGASATLPVALATGPHGELTLAGRTVVAMSSPATGRFEVDTLLLERSPRWQVDDGDRQRQVRQHEALARALAAGPVVLHFEEGATLALAPSPRGIAGVGALFWPVAALSLLLYLTGVVVVLARAHPANVLYLVMAWSQAASLALIAIELVRGIGLPPGFASLDLPARAAIDLVTAAAGTHSYALHPRRVPGSRLVGAAAWSASLTLIVLLLLGVLPAPWWTTQIAILAQGVCAIAIVSWSCRSGPNPFAAVMRRYSVIALSTLALVTIAVAAVAGQSGLTHTVGEVGAVVWYLFFASLLLLVPFLSRSRQVLREFAMLAGISTVATSLDLLFVAVFSLGQFTSLALAVFLALGAYAGARQWILNQMIGSTVVTTERAFDQLYRIAREVQDHPERYVPLMEQMLRDLYDPLEIRRQERAASVSRVVGGGSGLVVPVRTGSPDDPAWRPLSLVLRFAHRGKRLFSNEDARLADRVVQQLRRAVAYDRAVERGRSEERLRIAQDLHDDIGARLLTLMYQAQTPEMEDYIRHTLQDLKTLTRGLAKAEHRLSHATAEWKADITQRLTAAQVQLGWSVDYDQDLRLSVVQWSGLTRVLRELVSNALYHAQATRVDVQLHLLGRELRLSVADDGNGREPQHWSHGLGLGGVRKRVKLLGGEVRWRENTPRGIVCEVRVPEFAPPP